MDAVFMSLTMHDRNSASSLSGACYIVTHIGFYIVT